VFARFAVQDDDELLMHKTLNMQPGSAQSTKPSPSSSIPLLQISVAKLLEVLTVQLACAMQPGSLQSTRPSLSSSIPLVQISAWVLITELDVVTGTELAVGATLADVVALAEEDVVAGMEDTGTVDRLDVGGMLDAGAGVYGIEDGARAAACEDGATALGSGGRR
jgi:hypothetical protein